jgi:hypothetical protein
MSGKSRSGQLARRLAILAAVLATLAPPSMVSAQTLVAGGAVWAQAAPSLQSLTVTPAKAQVGAQIQVQAAGLAPGAVIDLSWETVTGGWVTRDYYHFGGKQFADSSQSLGGFRVGDDGRLAAEFTAPEDYGGVHNVVALRDGVALAQGALDLTQSFEMVPQEGPIGTPVEIRVKGLGWQTLESVWALNWDNREVGWVSALNTRGTAVARFRATGPVGDHVLKMYTGYMGQPYLNHEQAPTAYLPRPDFVFRTTAGGGDVPAAYAEPYVPQPVPVTTTMAGADLQLSPTQGPVGTQVALTGSGFGANQTLSVVWQTMVGNRLSSTGFAPSERVIDSVQTGPDGRVSLAISTPDDVGGLHALLLRAGDQEVARTYYVIETSIASISPALGPVGTTVTIHLKGVGWTEYDNIYTVNYDNAYMGYACGFNSQGDVVINFTASGAPGVHLIDLYPGLYDGPRDGQLLYRLPQLTYSTDHPGNTIPALRFAFVITDAM